MDNSTRQASSSIPVLLADIDGTVVTKDKVPDAQRNQLVLAVSMRTYKAYRSVLNSWRWQRICNAGTRPQRLQWASTGTQDPLVSDVLYMKALEATFVNSWNDLMAVIDSRGAALGRIS